MRYLVVAAKKQEERTATGCRLAMGAFSLFIRTTSCWIKMSSRQDAAVTRSRGFCSRSPSEARDGSLFGPGFCSRSPSEARDRSLFGPVFM